MLLCSFIKDTCSAIEDYVQDPQDNILSSILPCMNSTISDKILTGIGSTIHDFIDEVLFFFLDKFRSIIIQEAGKPFYNQTTQFLYNSVSIYNKYELKQRLNKKVPKNYTKKNLQSLV